ncbi:MAG: hypothetical protein AAFY60_20870 [Myxococcota bacterium]
MSRDGIQISRHGDATQQLPPPIVTPKPSSATGRGTTSAQTSATTTEIEIYPGVYERLRGSEETMAACRNGRVCKSKCFNCDQELFCIDDADFVVCPDCAMVSPTHGLHSKKLARATSGGVGLGIRLTQKLAPIPLLDEKF